MLDAVHGPSALRGPLHQHLNTNLYKGLLVHRYQVCRLLMAKLHVIAKHVYIQ